MNSAWDYFPYFSIEHTCPLYHLDWIMGVYKNLFDGEGNISKFSPFNWGGRMVRRYWVNFQCWGVLLI